MGAGVRPEPDDLDARIAARQQALASQPAPPDALDAKIAARQQALGEQPKATNEEQFGGAMLGGIPFGAKILGGLDAADKYIEQGDTNFGKNYSATRDRLLGAGQQARAAHPIAAPAVSLLTGALPFLGAGAADQALVRMGREAAPVINAVPGMGNAAKIGQGIKQGTLAGGAFGAAAGAGEATGGVDDYTDKMLHGAASGILFGGAVGGALPAAGIVGGGILDALNLRPKGTPTQLPPEAGPSGGQAAPKVPHGPTSPANSPDAGFRDAIELPIWSGNRSTQGGVAKSGPFIKRNPRAGAVATPSRAPDMLDKIAKETGSTRDQVLTEQQQFDGHVADSKPIGYNRGANMKKFAAEGDRTGAISFGDPSKSVSGIVSSILPESQSSRGESMLLRALEDAGKTPEQALGEYRAQSGKKPETFMEIAGKPGARLGRTVRSASPKAGQQIDAALEGRALGAPQRAIDDALETSGLQQRSSGFTTTQDLITQRGADAEKGYGPAFADVTPVADPKVREILSTPAGKSAWKRALQMMANDGVQVPTTRQNVPTELPTSAGFPKVSVSVPTDVESPTLQQLHYLKLALDDLKRPGMERGEGAGGIGYNEARSIGGVQKKLLGVMDTHSPAYKAARSKYAETSALKDANEAGRKLFSLHPDEAAQTLKDFGSDAEREVFRRAGMDALATRLENGPAAVSKGAEKPRDLARIRLLFPDDATFQQFKARVAREARMHETYQTASKGSQTLDKTADLADMMQLPTTAHGAMHPLRWAAGKAMQAGPKLSGRAIAERAAPDLVAGANGHPDELENLLKRLAVASQKHAQKAQRSSQASRALGAGVGTVAGQSNNPKP